MKRPHITSVFEVNGLPSIELPNRFPEISRSTIEKIRVLEDQCLFECDRIVCPSDTIKNHIVARGIGDQKVTVIPNGASIFPISARPRKMPGQYIVYFGALQPWQGVDVLIKAMQYLRDKPELKLVICSSHKEKHAKRFVKLISKLGLQDQVIWKHRLKQKSLIPILQHAIASIASLTECARNLEQGCSPLKIFESMAAKVPLIASDLPVVREILQDGVHAKLVRPDRPAELARAIRLFADYPDHSKTLAENAHKLLLGKYTWDKIDQQLSAFYENLLTLSYTNHLNHVENLSDQKLTFA
ncbi:MAG: glycosyltransferase [Ekhidna sp.]|nr:glycosyltransferase [Ekhidna sp.]